MFGLELSVSPPILYACHPRIDFLATFFRLNDESFECVLEDITERGETIYHVSDYVVTEVLRRFRGVKSKPKLKELYLKENNGPRTYVSAQMPGFWGRFLAKLEGRDWISQVVYLALLIGVAFKFTGLLNAVYVGLIGLAAAVIVSALQAFWDAARRKLQWRVE